MTDKELIERLLKPCESEFTYDPDKEDAAIRLEALTAENARLREALVLVDNLPDGEWETWDSCSFRRISRVGGGDGDVLCGIIQRSDNHPDLSWDKEQCDALCDFVNAARAALKGGE